MAEFLNKNIRHIRSNNKMSQQELAEKVGIDRSTISRIENNEVETTLDTAIKISDALNVPLNDLISKDLTFNNVIPIEISSNVKIPVYGTIKAGIPIESQEDIIEYVDIPEDWTKGNKKFFGLKISGDSMFPKYNENDIVIFEQNDDLEMYNGKDCAIMINGTESTFKKISVNENGIVLQPYNTSYDILFYSRDQVEQLPIRVVGIAREKRTKI